MRSFLMVALAGILAAGGGAALDRTLTAASDPWPPFVDPDHPRQGLSMEILRAALAPDGWTVKLEIMPWARAELAVQDGLFDLIPNTWMTEARKGVYSFSEPYWTNEMRFVKRRGDPFVFTGLPSLAGKVVGVINGYAYGNAFGVSPLFRREPANDALSNLRKLAAGRLDLTLDDSLVLRMLVDRYDPALEAKLDFQAGVLSSNPLYVVVGRNNPRGAAVLASFNKGLAKIRADGTLARILAGYGVR